jgi:sarcosine oxidase delta subunit
MKHNVAGQQTEWWYHRSGCGLWFLADRHNTTNEVLRTYVWRPKAAAPPEGAQDNQRASSQGDVSGGG